MIRSFLWRAYVPQIVLLAVVLAAHEACPISDESGDEGFSVAIERGALMLVASAAAWFIGMVLTGYFRGDFHLPKLPGFGSAGEKKEPHWVFVGLAVWLGFTALVVFVALIGAFLVPVYVLQLLVYLLYSIGLYNVFARTLGPEVLRRQREARAVREERGRAQRAQEEARRLQRIRLRQFDRQIDECQQELARRRQQCDAADPEADEILLLELGEKLRSLHQERAVFLDVNEANQERSAAQ